MTPLPLDVRRHYAPRYCEENVWQLCGQLGDAAQRALVAFVSNRARRVAIWHQRVGHRPEGLIAWDYHVVLLVPGDAGWSVYDPDSTLPCPCPAEQYLALSFQSLPERLARYRPRFRLVAAPLYRASLRSDRRHMREDDGHYVAPPPPWPCIGEGSNLMHFVDTEQPFLGEVMDLPQLAKRIDARASL